MSATTGGGILSVTPASAEVAVNGAAHFQAQLDGSNTTAVTWSLSETQNAGTVASSGHYTAPASAGTFHVVATSTADTTKKASATVTVSASAPPLSADCQKYCDCHEANCKSTAIPGGVSCATFCAAMTKDQYDCRMNMCNLVPAQPNNDHCTHSVGINECL
jgi:hypothetical protein